MLNDESGALGDTDVGLDIPPSNHQIPSDFTVKKKKGNCLYYKFPRSSSGLSLFSTNHSFCLNGALAWCSLTEEGYTEQTSSAWRVHVPLCYNTTRQAPTSASVFSLWDGCLTLLSLNFLMNYIERVIHFLQVVIWFLLHQNTQISDITITTICWDCTSVPYKEISGCFPTRHSSLISLLLIEWDLFSPLQAHLWLAPSLKRLHGSKVSMAIIWLVYGHLDTS